MATDAEIIVKLTAQTAQLKAGMAEGAAVVKTTQDEMAASMATSMNAFRNFDNITKQSVQSTEGLAAAQKALEAAQASGAFTAEELAAKQALVDAAMLKVSADAKGAAASMAVLGGSSRAAYSASALISDAMTGQFSRSRREVAALANETGLMSRVMRAALSPAGLLAGGIGVLTFATIKAEEDFNDFNSVVERTNGYMGTSAGELQAAAQKIESLGVSYSDAKEAVLDLASSGRFTGKQLLQAATSAAEFAQLTGEKVSQVDKLMVEMATNPQKALDELVEKYHRVTPAQAEVIEGLIKQGDKAAATAALVQAMGTSVAESFDKQAQHAGMLDKVLTTLGRDFGEVWRGIGESLNVATGGGDAAEKLTLLQHQLANMRASGETTGGYAVAYQALQKQAAELQTIIDKQHESAEAAKKTADAYAQAHPAQGTFAAFQKNGLEGVDVTGNLTRQLQTAEAAMKTSYGNREQFEEEYWGTILQKAQSGSAAYIQAWQHVQSLQRQIDERQYQESQEAARKQAEAFRKTAEEAKREAQGVARARQQALDDLAAQVKAASDAQIADAKQVATASIDAAKQGYDKVAEALRSQLQLHQITESQEIAGLESAEQRKYEVELAAYQKKMALLSDDPKEVAKIQAEIEKLTAQHGVVMKKLDDQQAAAFQKSWEDRLKPVSNAFDQMFTGMMRGTQTFRQAMANVLQNIAASFIKTSIDTTMRYIADEMAKTRAAQAEATQRVMITQSAAQQTEAAEAATGQKQIMSAAATAAAKAYQAVVGIPYVGPILAPIAAGVAFAAVEEFTGSLASAEGGWERVPADGMMTQLHRDEMVLPKNIADPMRDLARGRGNGGAGGDTYKVYAQDARGLADFVRRNGGTLSNSLRRMVRNGYR